MPEAKPWLEPLHEAKNVSFSVAGWIPPATPGMADDQNLALAAPVLQAELRALLPVKLPGRRRSLQHHSAMHLVAQFLDFGVVSGHIHSSRLSAGAGLSGRGLLFAPALPPARPSGCKGARNARKPATNPCSATGASGSHLRSFASHASFGQSWREREIGPKSRDDPRAKPPHMCARFPLSKNRARFPPRSRSVRIRPELTLGTGGQFENRDGTAKNGKPTTPLRRIAARGS